MKEPRWPQLWRNISNERNKRKKRSRWPGMDTLKNKDNKKFPLKEEVKMDWWDKFIKGLKEGRISVWIWIIILVGMLFSFSFSTINIDFSVEGDFDYKHPKIFQPKGDLND
jgi:hypothetical protein